MIQIVKIMGESFDINTGTELPKSIAVTNGHTTKIIPVPDEFIGELLELIAEVHSPAGNGARQQKAPAPQQPAKRGRKPKPPADDPGEMYRDEDGVDSI